MRRILLLFTLIVSSPHCYSHPGIGLVYDGQHTIYYTDLEHVWKINTDNGLKEIAVHNVHTHELFLDRKGNLYGEHYWYDQSQQLFYNYIWQLGQDRVLKRIRDEQQGENSDFGFVRDKYDRSYSIRENKGQFAGVMTDSTGNHILFSTKLKSPGWCYLSAEEILYFTDYPSIYAWDGKRLETIATDLSSSRLPFSLQSEHHHLYGIWTDRAQNIYVANYAGRVVQRIDPQGGVNSVLKSGINWSPLNGVYDRDQNLWLMESSLFGEIRVRKIENSRLGKSTSFLIENVFVYTIVILLIAILLYRFRKRKAEGISNRS